MTRNECLKFEIYVMDLAGKCKTAENFEKLSRELHEAIENALQDMCTDLGITDYDPPY